MRPVEVADWHEMDHEVAMRAHCGKHPAAAEMTLWAQERRFVRFGPPMSAITPNNDQTDGPPRLVMPTRIVQTRNGTNLAVPLLSLS